MIDNCDAGVVIVFNLFLLGNHKNDRQTNFTSIKDQSNPIHRILYIVSPKII